MSDLNPLHLLGVSPEVLKQLQRDLRTGMSALSSEHKRMQARLEVVNEALRQTTAKEHDLDITDHALLRYLERIEKMDLEPYRAKMRALAAGRYDPTDNHEVILDPENGAVLIIRGAVNGRPKPCVATVLDSETQGVPTQGQLSRIFKEDGA